jgi:CheY-like chemotaxis protein
MYLTALVRDNAPLIHATVPATIKIELKLEPDVPTVLIDAGQFQQVLLNLCTNAVHAIGPHSGRLTISVRTVNLPESDQTPVPMGCRPGLHVGLEVRDTGIGMDAKTKARIFDPFFTTKPVGEGTGLGLAMVRGIVADHGGGLRVESEPGRGAKFELYLPACAERQTCPVAAPARPPARGLGQRILVLDDEQVLLDVTAATLRRNGFAVTALNSPEAGLQRFAEAPFDFDLVVTDVAMPGMSGFDVATRILELRPDVPLVLMSGDFERFGANALGDIPGAGVLSKPFSVGELLEAVDRAFHFSPMFV